MQLQQMHTGVVALLVQMLPALHMQMLRMQMLQMQMHANTSLQMLMLHAP